MSYNKVVVNGVTKLDLTGDTIIASALRSGYTAHDKSGATLTGTMVVQTFRTGSTEPSNSLGNDGDLFFVTEG